MKTVKFMLALALSSAFCFGAHAKNGESYNASKKEVLTEVVSYQIIKALQSYSLQIPMLSGNEVLINFSISDSNLVEVSTVSSSNAFLAQYVKKALSEKKLVAKPINNQQNYQVRLFFK